MIHFEHFSYIFHIITVALCILVPTCIVCIGQAIISATALKQCIIQPSSNDEIKKCITLGLIIIETAALMGLLLAFMLLSQKNIPSSFVYHLGELGIACALPLTGALAGYASIQTIKKSCESIARQPLFAQKIKNSMLITTSLLQSSVLFGCIMALLIKSKLPLITTVNESIICICAGATIAIGSIGPACGLSFFGGSLCNSIGLNRNAYSALFSFALIAQALIEASLVFTLIIASLILNSMHTATQPWTCIAAGLAIGIGTIAPAIASGRVASRACLEIARVPHLANVITQMSITTQAIIETGTLYAMLIALFLLNI